MKRTTSTPRRRNGRRLGVHKRVRAVSRRTKKQLARVAQAAPRISDMPLTATTVADNVQAVLQALLGEMQRVKQEIAEQTRLAQERAVSGNDVGDDANQIAEMSKTLALKHHLERLLAQIQVAIRRIEQGLYGLCERCGQAIHPERLQALPYATTCMQCARAAG